MAPKPRASVVMTVYRDFRFLNEAVKSVLDQDLADIELIVVDDGNAEDALFQDLARRDPRIRIVTCPANVGTAVAANRGIEAAAADVIVRLDADDVAEPTRIGRLLAALDSDPDLGLVGSAVSFIDEEGRDRGVQSMPETDVDVRWTILFHNPFYHSAVAFRRDVFERAGGYRAHELVSQDHYLWFDMLPFCRAANLAEPLVRYRWNAQGLTAQNAGTGRQRTHAIREAGWKRLGLEYGLHDDGPAGDISHFLRGNDLAPERRGAAYLEILRLMRAFARVSHPQSRPGDRGDLRRLSAELVARMLQRPPPDRADRRKLYRACLSANPAETLARFLRALVRKAP